VSCTGHFSKSGFLSESLLAPRNEISPGLSPSKCDGFDKGTGVTRYKKDKVSNVEALIQLGLTERMNGVVNRPLIWSDVLVDCPTGGRGSAIKGQSRGRGMEDFVEEIVRSVFEPRFAPPRVSHFNCR